ncbi:NUDIX hydrolase [Octadecabacter sp. G9-8]|uniref:NUDIX hydrolase n=1 Tax=Octadecabacter dasysiphoniae TaxID=2909341 RepID=A0ABS9CRV0_9RHOB|nr:NUDIX hydrolase [Octadecabacter dasysiphoniae]MCF2869961.1 NUDIX hydrolase [Octadecabacter dasysiphoniae]
MIDKTAIRDAATVILLRDAATSPSILMGQRGATAAFMPNKYVFPGGAVDAGDAAIDVPVNNTQAVRLAQDSALPPNALAAAAIRELWEETGQILGRNAPWPADRAPHGWRGFAATGHVPDATNLEFVFRAVTPAGRPRRFDARFFLVDAAHLTTDPDDFSNAEDELSHLHWVPLSDARALDLPFITEVVLAEITARLTRGAPASVPFFRNDDESHLVTRLGGKRPLDD